MDTTYSAPLAVLFPAPIVLDAVASELNDLFSRIGLQSTTTILEPAPWINDPPPDLAPEASEDLSDEEFPPDTDSVELPAPEPPLPPFVVAPLPMGQRIVGLDLKALSEVVIDLTGLDGM